MNSHVLIRRLIFVYFLLLVLEGALRFWVFPGYSTPLLIVRDPIVIAIYMVAAGAGLFPWNIIVNLTLLLTIVSGILALTDSGVPFSVTLFGLRANYLHIPLIFIMPLVMRRSDVLRIGKWCMILMIPMAILVVRQFQSPIGTLINKGGYPTQYGTVRPAGTFSFVSGMVAFSSLVASYLAYSLTARRRDLPIWLTVSCAVAVMASLAVSGSRSTVAAVAIIFVMFVALSLTKGVATRGLIVALGVFGLIFVGLASTEFFEEGRAQLLKRFAEAGHGDIAADAEERFIDIFRAPFSAGASVPLFGYGIGLGTNAGAFLATGRHQFIGYETEWGRIVFEIGPILGWVFIALRIGITIQLLVAGISSFKRDDILSILLFGATAMNMAFGQWGVPTNQGFACFVGGLCLAASKFGEVRERIQLPDTPWWLRTPAGDRQGRLAKTG